VRPVEDHVHASRLVNTAGLLAAATLALTAVPACGGESEQSQGRTPAGTDSGEPGPVEPERNAAIYAAVVRQLVTKDHTFGGRDPGFKIVYVLDGVVEDAADPLKPVNTYDPQEPFPRDVKEGVRFLAKSADLPPIEFVAERDSVVAGKRPGADPGHVKNDGVLISLGPIEPTGRRVEVATSLWINGLAGQWLTYVLAQKGGTWMVTGTSGPMAIS
jgi:hypothetical protein